ncbi:hypothetical protein CYMTET_42696 [Cymbomonas tetramitiformis]|uniref:Uncharacterized protein n=1 Tax=Cymbomonas tetramitiformis TaxID=36881 RepID=A0AAE0C4Q9_9CHLO|nr:hypothetical protein CYMTET_42696 [Cymbomonas tetramitiformis]
MKRAMLRFLLLDYGLMVEYLDETDLALVRMTCKIARRRYDEYRILRLHKFVDTTAMIRFAITNKEARVRSHMLTLAIIRDRVDVLQLTLPSGRPGVELQRRLCRFTAKRNAVKCLSYLRDIGFEWDALVAVEAATFGSRECLEFALREGCPRDEEEITRMATIMRHLDCLKLALEHNCRMAKQILAEQRIFQVDEDNPCDVYLRTL